MVKTLNILPNSGKEFLNLLILVSLMHFHLVLSAVTLHFVQRAKPSEQCHTVETGRRVRLSGTQRNATFTPTRGLCQNHHHPHGDVWSPDQSFHLIASRLSTKHFLTPVMLFPNAFLFVFAPFCPRCTVFSSSCLWPTLLSRHTWTKTTFSGGPEFEGLFPPPKTYLGACKTGQPAQVWTRTQLPSANQTKIQLLCTKRT